MLFSLWGRRPPDDGPGGWTIDTLRTHLEAMIDAVDAKHAARTAADDAARDRLLASLEEADTRAAREFAALNDRITRAEGAIAGAKESKAGIYSLITVIGVVITIVVVIASIINGQGGQ